MPGRPEEKHCANDVEHPKHWWSPDGGQTVYLCAGGPKPEGDS